MPKIIAGPLALLATTMRHGVTVPRQDEAIRLLCSYLDMWRTDAEAGAWWPEIITRIQWKSPGVVTGHPGRPSWCYGTPGIARALQLAGLALEDADRQRQAEQALTDCLGDEAQLRHLKDASLCHGWTGLLRVSERIAADSTSGTLAALLPGLRARVTAHLDRHGPPADRGFLEGHDGVLLAQQDTPGATWDTCLLIGG